MKIFIDFDDVIFNTKKFREDLEALFDLNGVSKEIFQKYYADPKDQRAIKTFNPWLQAERIGRVMDFDVNKLTEAINEFVLDISKYVFVDVVDFANILGSKNIYVVSYGDLEFQHKKIDGSMIGKYLDNIVVTENLKSEIISKIIAEDNLEKNEEIFFLDDRIEQIRDVKEKFPEIISILVKRPEGRYQEMQKEDCCDYEVHNLMEAEKIIKNIEKN
ncbi:MAG: hypothetical protein US57_C0005G0030 [Candidatus Moranbacteria bacterium GW2011_GWC2_37_73]|nr:MAG: hypothetical protein UR95_C0001G0136 [Parcubacteria group bacterium GW2011_GWC1_36_108]KKQ01192.1 MAG: hypothetical protein US09_C0002G0030 [Candidatus Moranbacteria bacterium GW2011_GWD1_36_198]KKQ02393.1 MAG: hypothetical protein US10_C0002G0017 [Candidatus Moranbacteria bacterium GW2011_GWD2_36_198]KKQ40074.1 MAG: hypothetical protein US57_C0005G0030 [Candidatus Moranbacteria bacterium GW2011_GWC2_37_73]HAR99544.1 hypothetical protein [Candidatus Moranbacteria bacterium]